MVDADHELEVQTDGDERHEVEADGTEEHSDDFVNQSHNVEGPVSIFARVISSELRNSKFDGIAGRDFMIDKGVVVKAGNVHNGCEGHVLVDDTQNISHARQNDHDVDFDDETDDSLE